MPSFLGDKSEWRFTVLSKRVNSPEEYSFFSFAWKRASVWYSEVQIRDIFRSLPKECPKNGKLMRSLRMIFFTVTTVLTFCREITVSKAYFLLTFKPTSKWCAFRFIHSDLLYILLWKSLDKKKSHFKSSLQNTGLLFITWWYLILLSQFSIFKLIWTIHINT